MSEQEFEERGASVAVGVSSPRWESQMKNGTRTSAATVVRTRASLPRPALGATLPLSQGREPSGPFDSCCQVFAAPGSVADGVTVGPGGLTGSGTCPG